MKKHITLLTALVLFTGLTACGNPDTADTAPQPTAPNAEAQTEKAEEITSETDIQTEADTEPQTEAEETTSAPIVQVENNIFDTELTISADIIGETTQEHCDEVAKEKGYKSVTLNSDGSVTFVMTKQQHKDLIAATKEQIDTAIKGMINSESYPTFTNIKANDDYTHFTVTTTNETLSVSESMSAMNFYMFGGMYGMYCGKKPDNISVDYVNAATGAVIDTANSNKAQKIKQNGSDLPKIAAVLLKKLI